MSQQTPNPMSSMKTGNQNVHHVTLNGRTQVVTGANDASSAARQAFGNNGNQARVQQTETKKWT